MKHTIFFVLAGIGLLYCTAPATQARHKLAFYIRYLQEEDQFRAEATMTEEKPGSDAKPVEIPGGIQYAGVPMQLLPVKGLTYFREGRGDFVPKQPFSWKNAKGEPQKFVMDFEPVLNFGFAGKTVDRSKPATFRWSGSPLAKGEEMLFLWSNLKTGENNKMDIIGANSVPEIEFPAAKLGQLAAGQWALYVVRRKLVKSEADGIPVDATIEYYTKTDTLTLR